MTRALRLVLSSLLVPSGLLLAAGVGAVPQTPGRDPQPPVEAEAQREARQAAPNAAESEGLGGRWRHNPRGRTEAGIELQNGGELAAAGDAFGEALGLAPADPVVRYNAGTASLLASDERAVEFLQSAAAIAPPELAPLAYYNLGNAHFASQDLPGAIESYKQSLRLDPGNLDAKHNLELAQRLLEQQQQEQNQQQDQEQQQEQEQDQQQEQQQGEQQQEQQPDPQEQQEQQQDPDSRLPDFEDQPDMTAEQAAAILEAVENLEREQRRKQAMEQLKRAKGDRDW